MNSKRSSNGSTGNWADNMSRVWLGETHFAKTLFWMLKQPTNDNAAITSQRKCQGLLLVTPVAIKLPRREYENPEPKLDEVSW